MELPTSLNRNFYTSLRRRKHLLRDYTQRLGPTTRNLLAGSAWSRKPHQPRTPERFTRPMFDLRYTTVRRHTACLQVRPGSIEKRSKQYQSYSRRKLLVGTIRPASKDSSSTQNRYVRVRTAISSAMTVISTGGIPKPPMTSTEIIPKPGLYISI